MGMQRYKLAITFFGAMQFAFSFALSTQSSPSTVYLVAVGVSNYRCIDNLRLPQYDAKSVAALFLKNKADVTLLINEHAIKSNIMKALSSVFMRAAPNDMILFFFSGHGFSDGFCTYTTNCKGGNYITYDELKTIFSKSKANRKLIFADACFSGAIRAEAKRKKAELTFENQHVMLFLSSRANEKSFERSDMQNGFFTSFLLKGLEGKADKNRDKIITSRELFDYVSKNVAEISREQQHPVMWGKFSDRLIIMRNK